MDNQEITAHDQQPISVGEWVLYLFLLSIPLVNIVILGIWAFGSEPNQTKKNFARAGLIWIAIGFIFYLLLMFLIFGTFSSMMNDMNNMQAV